MVFMAGGLTATVLATQNSRPRVFMALLLPVGWGASHLECLWIHLSMVDERCHKIDGLALWVALSPHCPKFTFTS